jgi:superfamily II DNA or RNA helicase
MSITIELHKNTAILLGETDYSILAKLDLELSYRLTGYEYTQAFIHKRWDGFNRLLTKNLEFPCGLVPRVIQFFDNYGKSVNVIDTNSYKKYKSTPIIKRLIELKKVPRDYQILAAQKAVEHKRGIIKIATGGGKTLVASLIAAELGGNIVIYVIGKDLLHQFHKFFETVFQTDIGIVGDGLCRIRPITIASIWSVGLAFGVKQKPDDYDEEEKEKKINEETFREIKNMVSSANISILDECHYGAAATMQKIGKAINSEYTLGMSARPKRDDNANLLIEGIFGKIIVNISASELINKGYLVQPHIHFIPVPRRIGMGKTYREIYKNFIVENDTRNNLVVKGGMKLVEQGFKTIILYREIEHGKIIYSKLLDKGVNCRLLSGKMSSDIRDHVVREFVNDECDLIVASSIFDIGIDIPVLSGLVIASSGKSSIKALQRLGRALRPTPEKEMAAIIDFNDNCKYLKNHSKIRRDIYEQEDGFIVKWK